MISFAAIACGISGFLGRGAQGWRYFAYLYDTFTSTHFTLLHARLLPNNKRVLTAKLFWRNCA